MGKVVVGLTLMDARQRKVFKAALAKQQRGTPRSRESRAGATWPLSSRALAVHPRQVKEAAEYAKKIGCPTNFLPDGRPVFTGKAHRKEYCERHGYYDQDGGYGDPQKGTTRRIF